MPAVLIDARASNPSLAGKVGSEIKSFTDGAVNKLGSLVLFYKLETLFGNIAGFLCITLGDMGNKVEKIDFVLRPAFQSFTEDLENQIQNFVQTNGYQVDFL